MGKHYVEEKDTSKRKTNGFAKFLKVIRNYNFDYSINSLRGGNRCICIYKKNPRANATGRN